MKINEDYHDEFFFGTSYIVLGSYEAVCSSRDTYTRGELVQSACGSIGIMLKYSADWMHVLSHESSDTTVSDVSRPVGYESDTLQQIVTLSQQTSTL